MPTHVNYDNMYSLLSGVIGNLKSKINSIDLTEQQKSQLALIDKILKTGNGTNYLSDNGTYKNIPIDKVSGMNDNIKTIYDLLKIDYNNSEYWDSNVSNMSFPMYAFGCIEYNGKVYCIGGYDGNATVYNRVDIYNISTNTWTSGASAPIQIAGQGCIQYNGKIYCIGGINGSKTRISTLYIYDILSNSWSTGTSIPVAVESMGSVYYNGKIYIFGGYSSSILSTVYIYNISTNSWSTGTSMPNIRCIINPVCYNAKIYCTGGADSSNVTNTNYIYDILNNTWSSGAVIPKTLYGHSAFLYNGKIYCMGGYISTAKPQSAVNTIYIYNITSNSWNTDSISMITGRYRAGYILYNNRLYIMSGITGTTSTTLTTISSIDIFHLIYMSYNITLPSDISNKLSLLITNGTGTKLLTDNGTYQEYIPSGYREMNSNEMNTLVNFINTSF